MTAEHIDQDGSIIVKMPLSLVHVFGGTVVVGHLSVVPQRATNRRAFFCWVCCPLCGRDYCVEGTAPFRHKLLLTINIVAVSVFLLVEQQDILYEYNLWLDFSHNILVFGQFYRKRQFRSKRHQCDRNAALGTHRILKIALLTYTIKARDVFCCF